MRKDKASSPSPTQDWFEKLPVRIQAKQWFRDGDHVDVDSPPPHCTAKSDMRCAKCGNPSGEHGWIRTLEGGSDGAQLVCPGDWIIIGIEGEHYPCKPNVFAKTYRRWIAPEISEIPPDDYVAWCKYVNHPNGSTTIRTCDQGDVGAFRVYRAKGDWVKVAEKLDG